MRCTTNQRRSYCVRPIQAIVCCMDRRTARVEATGSGEDEPGIGKRRLENDLPRQALRAIVTRRRHFRTPASSGAQDFTSFTLTAILCTWREQLHCATCGLGRHVHVMGLRQRHCLGKGTFPGVTRRGLAESAKPRYPRVRLFKTLNPSRHFIR